ncbi:hypothetical protein SIO70_09775 [Chitinophaga sancti]|uniref:hypothetical protein n=1 Tax=Chitinophaga sancti TaxID=1004 RepID=UPI002A7485CB|nr:hypothetical protein [Chitinophaga sancti]WPQ65132.1 hypothetical protein SIO70_09775 [Chitinophaga sancti]
MKRKPLIFAALATVAVISAALVSSCKKDASVAGDRALSATQVVPTSSTLSGVLGTGHTVVDSIHLTSSVAWHLSGLVYVDSADVLIIDAGTTIRGDLSTSSSVPGGGLVITRGAKLLAQGTAASPIVFTSAATTPVSGDWSGVVILGNAPTNHSGRVQVEGIPTNPPANATFGGTSGTVSTDNSGTLRYVRIEYGGYELSTDNEINGLTLAGVGSGTTIDHIEIYKSKDDAIEFFGGTVNVSYLISVDALDDMFDFDNGYSGSITYALGLSDTSRADKSASNGIESDNNSTGDSTATPVTKPVINYMTVIGVPATRSSITNGAPSGTGTYGRAAHLRRSSRFTIQNSVFMGFNKGISLDGALGNTPCAYARGLSTLYNVLVQGYVTPFGIEGTSPCSSIVTIGGDNTAYPAANGVNANIKLVNPFVRPTTASAANFFPANGGDAASFGAGAFTFGGVDWTSGWSKY